MSYEPLHIAHWLALWVPEAAQALTVGETAPRAQQGGHRGRANARREKASNNNETE